MRYKLQSLDNEILITILKYEEHIQRNQSETRKKLMSLPIPTRPARSSKHIALSHPCLPPPPPPKKNK